MLILLYSYHSTPHHRHHHLNNLFNSPTFLFGFFSPFPLPLASPLLSFFLNIPLTKWNLLLLGEDCNVGRGGEEELLLLLLLVLFPLDRPYDDITSTVSLLFRLITVLLFSESISISGGDVVVLVFFRNIFFSLVV